ncbi:MAG: DNA/RNA nuclease SfsA [Spirochaetia bacterium]|nr:DNA/RNA nuclease SfsA [Spirochaetia bacterium]
MHYGNILHGTFLSRPNRFIAIINIGGQEVLCHVKNTGRCRELLVPGADVILEDLRGKGRKTDFDLIQVYKNGRLINMDSQAPNKAVKEWLEQGNLYPDLTLIRPETCYGSSRFDFYMERPGHRIFMEVKGGTLEQDGKGFLRDAPSERGVRHIHELMQAKKEGYEAIIMFVIQMSQVLSFSPNDITHPEFGKALRQASEAGVSVLAFDCHVTPGTMEIGKPVKISL